MQRLRTFVHHAELAEREASGSEVDRPKRTRPSQEIIEKMGAYNEALVAAGVLLAGEGLADDTTVSCVVDFAGEAPVATNGP
ncbi:MULTISPECIES: hypothetical protein [unclassified Cryobacterium]|uniref:hypothetical protein n=1 Tax=unclassified Cryobacterium TaxID=2649013 RepID=UPI001A1FDD04